MAYVAKVEEVANGEEINPLESDPFQYNGGGAFIDLDDNKKYNASQLASELEHKTGAKKVSLALINHEGKRRLWFAPANLDKRTVRGAVKSHRENENWGLTEEDVEVKDLVHRLKSGKTLTVEETTRVLKAMVIDKEDTGMTVEE